MGWAQLVCYQRPFRGGISHPHPGHALALGPGSLCLPPPVLPAFPVRPGQLESPNLALVRSSVTCTLHSVSLACSTLLCSLLFSVLFWQISERLQTFTSCCTVSQLASP